MKKITALLLALALLLCGCGAKTAPETTVPPETAPVTTAAPTTEPTTEPTTIPTTEAIVYTNPLNGEVIDAPFTGRIFANTISNVPKALPHVGVNEADMLMEMFVNGSNVRCLALFSDIEDVEMIGSTRSTRLMFNDITQHLDLILCHAYGSDPVMRDAAEREIEDLNLDKWAKDPYYSVRDPERDKKLGWEHCLMGIGSGIIRYAEESGYSLTRPEGQDYGFRFTENGTPADGEDAANISIMLTYKGHHKESIMIYDAELQKYVYNQHGQEMTDGITGEKEAFTNVVVMHAEISSTKGYQVADFLAGGTGYFACGGKIIPITWTCDGEDQPFYYFLESGEPLLMGVGNTYMAICTPESEVVWTAE